MEKSRVDRGRSSNQFNGRDSLKAFFCTWQKKITITFDDYNWRKHTSTLHIAFLLNKSRRFGTSLNPHQIIFRAILCNQFNLYRWKEFIYWFNILLLWICPWLKFCWVKLSKRRFILNENVSTYFTSGHKSNYLVWYYLKSVFWSILEQHDISGDNSSILKYEKEYIFIKKKVCLHEREP